MGLLVVTPLKEELSFLCQGLRGQGFVEETDLIGKIETRIFPEAGLTVARGGHGKAQCGLQTQYLLDHGKLFDGVICAGAAGAIAPGLAIGDIVVAEATVEHDFRLRFVTRPLPHFVGEASWLAQLRQASPGLHPFGVHYGIMASGDEDVVSVERGSELHAQLGALAVAWEGAGVARASLFSQVPFLEIRSITDTADHSAPADFDANLEVAMAHLGCFLGVLSGLLPLAAQYE